MPSALAASRAERIAACSKRPRESPSKPVPETSCVRSSSEHGFRDPKIPRKEDVATLPGTVGLAKALELCENMCIRSGPIPNLDHRLVLIKTTNELGEIATVQKWLGGRGIVRYMATADSYFGDFVRTCINMKRPGILLDLCDHDVDPLREAVANGFRAIVLHPDVYEYRFSALARISKRMSMPHMSEAQSKMCIIRAFDLLGLPEWLLRRVRGMGVSEAIHAAYYHNFAVGDREISARQAVESRVDGRAATVEMKHYVHTAVTTMPTIDACLTIADALCEHLPEPETSWMMANILPEGLSERRREAAFFADLRQRQGRNQRCSEIKTSTLFPPDMLKNDRTAMATEAAHRGQWVDRGFLVGDRFSTKATVPLIFERGEGGVLALLGTAMRTGSKRDVALVRQRSNGWNLITDEPNNHTCPRSIGEWFGPVGTADWRRAWSALADANISRRWKETIKRLVSQIK